MDRVKNLDKESKSSIRISERSVLADKMCFAQRLL